MLRDKPAIASTWAGEGAGRSAKWGWAPHSESRLSRSCHVQAGHFVIRSSIGVVPRRGP